MTILLLYILPIIGIVRVFLHYLLTHNIEGIFRSTMHELAHPLIEAVSFYNTYFGQQVLNPWFFSVKDDDVFVITLHFQQSNVDGFPQYIRYGII